MTSETRITDPTTGGQKGQKLAQLGSLDPLALMAVAEVSGFGNAKYERYNYARGYRWSLSYDALQRHLNAFWGGQNLDAESGLPHLAHAAWHCLALLCFSLRGRGTDDRFPAGGDDAVLRIRIAPVKDGPACEGTRQCAYAPCEACPSRRGDA